MPLQIAGRSRVQDAGVEPFARTAKDPLSTITVSTPMPLGIRSSKDTRLPRVFNVPQPYKEQVVNVVHLKFAWQERPYVVPDAAVRRRLF